MPLLKIKISHPSVSESSSAALQLEGAGIIRQGTLEASNVNVVEEMVNMIETQRAYEVNSKSISATDGMLRFLTNTL